MDGLLAFSKFTDVSKETCEPLRAEPERGEPAAILHVDVEKDVEKDVAKDVRSAGRRSLADRLNAAGSPRSGSGKLFMLFPFPVGIPWRKGCVGEGGGWSCGPLESVAPARSLGLHRATLRTASSSEGPDAAYKDLAKCQKLSARSLSRTKVRLSMAGSMVGVEMGVSRCTPIERDPSVRARPRCAKGSFGSRSEGVLSLAGLMLCSARRMLE